MTVDFNNLPESSPEFVAEFIRDMRLISRADTTDEDLLRCFVMVVPLEVWDWQGCPPSGGVIVAGGCMYSSRRLVMDRVS